MLRFYERRHIVKLCKTLYRVIASLRIIFPYFLHLRVSRNQVKFLTTWYKLSNWILWWYTCTKKACVPHGNAKPSFRQQGASTTKIPIVSFCQKGSTATAYGPRNPLNLFWLGDKLLWKTWAFKIYIYIYIYIVLV